MDLKCQLRFKLMSASSVFLDFRDLAKNSCRPLCESFKNRKGSRPGSWCWNLQNKCLELCQNQFCSRLCTPAFIFSLPYFDKIGQKIFWHLFDFVKSLLAVYVWSQLGGPEQAFQHDSYTCRWSASFDIKQCNIVITSWHHDSFTFFQVM